MPSLEQQPLPYQNNASGPFQYQNNAQQPLLCKSKEQQKKGSSNKLSKAIKKISNVLSSMLSSNTIPPHLSNCACNYHARKREEYKQKCIAEAKQQRQNTVSNNELLHGHDVHGKEVFSCNPKEFWDANNRVCGFEGESEIMCTCNNNMHMRQPTALSHPNCVQCDMSQSQLQGVDERSKDFIRKSYENPRL